MVSRHAEVCRRSLPLISGRGYIAKALEVEVCVVRKTIVQKELKEGRDANPRSASSS